MTQTSFYNPTPSLTLAEIAASVKAELDDVSLGDRLITGLAALDAAGPMHLAFFDNLKYADQLAATQAGACLVNLRYNGPVPDGVVALRVKDPFGSYVALASEWQPDAMRPQSGYAQTGVSDAAVVHPSAHLEDNVTIDPLAVIGPNVEIGEGTIIGSGVVLAAGVKIGRNSSIGSGVSIQYALIGDDVIIHPGCRIGQDGFGFIFGRNGSTKVPQCGRVIIQNRVEIGAGSTVDRGSLRDTVIGEGTKIDNQVQVGHNVYIGRNTVIAAQCGLAGSLTIEDNVLIGARVGLNNHITIGRGAQIAAASAVKDSIPAGAKWGGMPAKPAKQWWRELVTLERLSHGILPNSVSHQAKKDEGSE